MNGKYDGRERRSSPSESLNLSISSVEQNVDAFDVPGAVTNSVAAQGIFTH